MRRTKEDAARTRAAIVDAALCCFDRHGITGSTMAHIAEEAKCTKGAVYHYFGDKREILHELRDQVSVPMMDEADCELLQEREMPALERIERYLLGILESVEGDARTRAAITVMQFRCEYVDDLAEELQAGAKNQERMMKAFEAAYREAQRAGQLAPGLSPAAAALETMMFLSGLLRLTLIHGKGSVVSRNARAAVRGHIASKRR